MAERPVIVKDLVATALWACAVMFLAGCAFVLFLDHWEAAPVPLPLSAAAIREGLSLAPAMILAASVVFVATSVHWKRVGDW